MKEIQENLDLSQDGNTLEVRPQSGLSLTECPGSCGADTQEHYGGGR